MIKCLVITLVSYLVIGAVFWMVKMVYEARKRFNTLDDEAYDEWVNCSEYVDDYCVCEEFEDEFDDELLSEYFWYIKFISKLLSANVNEWIIRAIVILTWPVAIPLFTENRARWTDAIYESRFGEEG